MYTYAEAEYLKKYYWNKIVGQRIGTGDIFRDMRIKEAGNKFEIHCHITESAYSQLEKTTQDLDLISPAEVLKNRK